MKALRILTQIAFVLLFVAAMAIFAMIAYADMTLSDNYYIVEGKQLKVSCQIPITSEYDDFKVSQRYLTVDGQSGEFNVNFKLFGVFPVSSATVKIVDEMAVEVLGTPFGVKIYTDGVLVVGTGEVDAADGNINPASEAGIKVGDTISSIDGQAVNSNEDVQKIVESSGGKELTLVIIRDSKTKKTKIKPILSKSAGVYRIGIWVRDSTAGIGTLTFYSPANRVMCGLGHGICDSDTDQLMSVSSGELVGADIVSYVKGQVGAPGELKGRLNNSFLGDLLLNSETGVYARAGQSYEKTSKLMKIALKQDVQNGKAYIYTTVEGELPTKYSCKIKLCNEHVTDDTHNLIITITDQRLLNSTGGIVQGMSGSPIVQNGKLVGAVTHVFVNDPTKGYGIFAENMLETAQSVAESNKLKEAS